MICSVIVASYSLAIFHPRYFGRDRNVVPRAARKVRVMQHSSILTRFALWRRRSHTRRQLRDLPPHLLADIGIDNAARDDECRRWPWQGRAGDAPKENGRRLRAPVGEFAVSDRS